MLGLKRYVRKVMCNCRVCLTARYIMEKYGGDACEEWMHKGFDLEGQFNLGEITKQEYEIIYNKRWIKKLIGNM